MKQTVKSIIAMVTWMVIAAVHSCCKWQIIYLHLELIQG